MIPKIIHQIWVGPYRIPKRELESVRTLKEKLPDWEHHLWTDDARVIMSSNMQEAYDYYGTLGDYVAQANILRLFVVKEFGGVYMDIDFDVLAGFEGIDFSQSDSFFCWHDTDISVCTFPNGVFGGAKGSKIIAHLCKHVHLYLPNGKIHHHTPWYFGKEIREYFGLPEGAPHLGDDGILKCFEQANVCTIPWKVFRTKHFRHNDLYSHSPENKKKFAAGDYE